MDSLRYYQSGWKIRGFCQNRSNLSESYLRTWIYRNMRLIDPSYEIIPQEEGLLGVYKQIEIAARTAYKSEDKIAEGSAQRMVEALCKASHGAALEHGTIYLKIPMKFYELTQVRGEYLTNPYSKIRYTHDSSGVTQYVTTNARVIFENGWEDDLQFMCGPTEFHEKRITVKFTTSIVIVREILRHRHFSFLNESTRYCNYSKAKFGSELTFIIPEWIYNLRNEKTQYVDSQTGEPRSWLLDKHGEDLIEHLVCIDRSASTWWHNLIRAQDDYNYLITTDEGYKLKPEEARGILPLDLKSELIVTGFVEDWIHFFRLRSYIAATGKPHPDIQILADPLMQEFIDRGYCTYEEIHKE